MSCTSTRGAAAFALGLSLASVACGSSVSFSSGGEGGGDGEGGTAGGSSSSGSSSSSGASACVTGSGLEAVAPEEHGGSFIRVHDGWVYWSAESAIRRAPREGGPAETVVAIDLPMGLDVDDDGVFFVTHDGDDVLRVDPQGGPLTSIAHHIGIGGAFAMVRLDEGHAYYRGGCSELYRVALPAGDPELVAYDESCIGSFAVHAQSVYYVHWQEGGGAIRRVAKDGGLPTTVVPAAQALAGGYSGAAPGIAVADGRIYWVGASFVASATTEGADLRILADGLDAAQDVVVDGDWVYWSEYAHIGKVRRDGSETTTVAAWSGASDLSAGIGPMGLAIAGDDLYFTNYITTAPVLRVCK